MVLLVILIKFVLQYSHDLTQYLPKIKYFKTKVLSHFEHFFTFKFLNAVPCDKSLSNPDIVNSIKRTTKKKEKANIISVKSILKYLNILLFI